MIINDPSLINKIALWRMKVADGTITLDEMKEGIIALRGNRKASVELASATRSAGGKRSKAPSVEAVDAMLNELEGL